MLLRVQLQWAEGEKNPLGGNCITPFGLSTEQWSSIDVNDYQALDICVGYLEIYKVDLRPQHLD